MSKFIPVRCRFLIISLAYSIAGLAQEKLQYKPIETDRPDQTETSAIVPNGMFQIETGFVYERIDAGQTNIVTPTILAKYGVNENFELRLIVEYNTWKIGNEKQSGFNPLLIGTKIKLSDEKGIIPKTSFIGHLLVPDFASPEFKAGHSAVEFRFTMQHTLSDKVNLGYNLGAEWDGVLPDATYIYTFTTGFSLSGKIGAYAEVFGFAPENQTANHSADAGFTYLISNDMMFDLSGGVGITENAPDYFLSCGFSFRI